jgi:hypothetical protein
LGKSTSSQTINESLPPSSRVTGIRVSDALCMICDKHRNEDFRKNDREQKKLKQQAYGTPL